MVSIFTVMGLVGSTAPRAVAGGVSTAIITTMAGMVGALSGLFPAAYLSRQVQLSMQRVRSDPMLIATTPVSRMCRIHPFPRMVAAGLAGIVVTLALVNAMEAMARFSGEVIVNERVHFRADFIRVERQRRVDRVEAKPDRPEVPENRPELAEIRPELTETSSSNPGLLIQAPVADLNASLTGLQTLVRPEGFIADSDYLPIVTIAPVYPARALAQRIEGWVLVSFTVTANGTVRDVVVLESSDSIFERTAIAAAEKFRYKPRVSNGQPIEVTGVQNRIWFHIAAGSVDANASQSTNGAP
jgi:protein TonB